MSGTRELSRLATRYGAPNKGGLVSRQRHLKELVSTNDSSPNCRVLHSTMPVNNNEAKCSAEANLRE